MILACVRVKIHLYELHIPLIKELEDRQESNVDENLTDELPQYESMKCGYEGKLTLKKGCEGVIQGND